MLVWVFLFIVLRVKGQVKGNERSEPQEPSYLYRITHTFFFGIIRHPHVLTCFSLIQLSRNELDKSRSRPLQHFTLSFHPVTVPGLQLLISTLCPNSAMERGYLQSKISPSHILLPSFGLAAQLRTVPCHGYVLQNNITCTFSVTFLIPLIGSDSPLSTCSCTDVPELCSKSDSNDVSIVYTCYVTGEPDMLISASNSVAIS